MRQAETFRGAITTSSYHYNDHLNGLATFAATSGKGKTNAGTATKTSTSGDQNRTHCDQNRTYLNCVRPIRDARLSDLPVDIPVPRDAAPSRDEEASPQDGPPRGADKRFPTYGNGTDRVAAGIARNSD